MHIDEQKIKEIKIWFEKMARPEFLETVAHCKTQNANECFNSVVWSILPKNIFINHEAFDLGLNMALLLFNEGYIRIIATLKFLGVPIGPYMLKRCLSFDALRIKHAEKMWLNRRLPQQPLLANFLLIIEGSFPAYCLNRIQ